MSSYNPSPSLSANSSPNRSPSTTLTSSAPPSLAGSPTTRFSLGAIPETGSRSDVLTRKSTLSHQRKGSDSGLNANKFISARNVFVANNANNASVARIGINRADTTTNIKAKALSSTFTYGKSDSNLPVNQHKPGGSFVGNPSHPSDSNTSVVRIHVYGIENVSFRSFVVQDSQTAQQVLRVVCEKLKIPEEERGKYVLFYTKNDMGSWESL